jgi:hypothetical protein
MTSHLVVPLHIHGTYRYGGYVLVLMNRPPLNHIVLAIASYGIATGVGYSAQSALPNSCRSPGR